MQALEHSNAQTEALINDAAFVQLHAQLLAAPWPSMTQAKYFAKVASERGAFNGILPTI